MHHLSLTEVFFRVRALLIVLLLVSSTAWAKPTAAQRAGAQKHYEAGVAHYKAGEFVEAAAEFEEALALRPMPQWLFNLASAYRAAKQPEKALENYQKYLEAAPDAPNRAQVEQRIAEAQREIDAKAPPPEPVRAAPPPSARPPKAVAPAAEAAPRPAHTGPKTPYELGYRLRYLFVTRAMLSPYLDAATQMNSWSQGIEFIYHRRTYDVVTSLDFSWLPVDDGNYLSKGHDPSRWTMRTTRSFRNLSFLSVDVSIIGHTDVTKWLLQTSLRRGPSGVGVVFGQVLLTNDSGSCTKQNASNFSACHPLGVDPTKPLEPQLKATESNPGTDTADSPKRHVSKDKPPAMAVLNLEAGARFQAAAPVFATGRLRLPRLDVRRRRRPLRLLSVERMARAVAPSLEQPEPEPELDPSPSPRSQAPAPSVNGLPGGSGRFHSVRP